MCNSLSGMEKSLIKAFYLPVTKSVNCKILFEGDSFFLIQEDGDIPPKELQDLVNRFEDNRKQIVLNYLNSLR